MWSRTSRTRRRTRQKRARPPGARRSRWQTCDQSDPSIAQATFQPALSLARSPASGYSSNCGTSPRNTRGDVNGTIAERSQDIHRPTNHGSRRPRGLRSGIVPRRQKAGQPDSVPSRLAVPVFLDVFSRLTTTLIMLSGEISDRAPCAAPRGARRWEFSNSAAGGWKCIGTARMG